MSVGARFSMVRFAVLPLATLAMALGASPASATSGGCLPPSIVASIYGSNVSFGFPYASFFDNVSLSDDSGRLKAQCKDFLKGCKVVVKQATRCIEGAVSSVRSGQLVGCKDESSSDIAACKDSVKVDAANFLGLIKQDKTDAFETCQQCYEDCLEGVTGSCGFAGAGE